jgi:aryl carrier-like protein
MQLLSIIMCYSMPKKIQLQPSQAKWAVASSQSVLVLVGLHELRQHTAPDTELMQNIMQLLQKAKALDIPVLDLYGDDALQAMQRLGELLAHTPQLMIAGQMTPMIKQILPHLYSATEQICVIDDAILLNSQEQHIHMIDSLVLQGFHHMSSYNLKRLWSLSAPTEQVLSNKGILLAVAEQLDMDALELDPSQDLRSYGLDSVAMVSLIGLWRANGANIRYEDFLQHNSLQALLTFLNTSHQ